MVGHRKPKGITAAEAAALPPEQRPEWYRPANGAGNGAEAAPPFAEGNVQRLGSGYRSPRVYSSVATALVAGLTEQRADLRAFPEALASWGDAEARAALLRKHLDDIGLVDTTGEPRESLLRQLDRFERRASGARVQLGLDPRSEAELALLRARAMREGQLTPQVDLTTLAEQGRAALNIGADPVREALEQTRAEAEAAELTPRLDQQHTHSPQNDTQEKKS